MLLVWLIAVSFLMFVCLLVWLLRLSLRVVIVRGQSMAPTLAAGDRVLVWRFWPKRWLRRGQIVLVCPWGNPEEDLTRFLKRIVGVAGDTLVTTLDELPEALRAAHARFYDAQGRRTWQIPAGHLFVRGDHRQGSIDSTSWGAVPAQRVYGVVFRKLSAPHQFQAPTAVQRPSEANHQPPRHRLESGRSEL